MQGPWNRALTAAPVWNCPRMRCLLSPAEPPRPPNAGHARCAAGNQQAHAAAAAALARWGRDRPFARRRGAQGAVQHGGAAPSQLPARPVQQVERVQCAAPAVRCARGDAAALGRGSGKQYGWLLRGLHASTHCAFFSTQRHWRCQHRRARVLLAYLRYFPLSGLEITDSQFKDS